MSDKTAIEWSDATWNFLVGCSKVSAGCTNCYAIRSVARMSGNPQFGARYQGLVTVGERPLNWTGRVTFLRDRLEIPLKWREPRRVFVNSLSDLFHPDVAEEWIDDAFRVMAVAQQHTFQILTKRPERMAAYLAGGARQRIEDSEVYIPGSDLDGSPVGLVDWPLPNVWLGTSTEDQATADERIPWLIKTPAAVRFLSCEPLLGSIDISAWLKTQSDHPCIEYMIGEPCPCQSKAGLQRVDWVITGGESGPHHRYMQPEWARFLRDQCQAAGVAYFHKQNGGRTAKENGRLLDGVEWSQFPELARVPATV